MEFKVLTKGSMIYLTSASVPMTAGGEPAVDGGDEA